MEPTSKKLLDRTCTEPSVLGPEDQGLVESIRDAIRLKHYSIRTDVAPHRRALGLVPRPNLRAVTVMRTHSATQRSV